MFIKNISRAYLCSICTSYEYNTYKFYIQYKYINIYEYSIYSLDSYSLYRSTLLFSICLFINIWPVLVISFIKCSREKSERKKLTNM